MRTCSRWFGAANNSGFTSGRDFFLEHYSQPPFRSRKTHAANQNVLKHLKPVFGVQTLSAIGAEEVEEYLRWRLRQQKRVRDTGGVSGTRAAEAVALDWVI